MNDNSWWLCHEEKAFILYPVVIGTEQHNLCPALMITDIT